MLGKALALSTLTAFVLLSAILQVTSPSTIHPLGILMVFILMYVLALGALTFFLLFLGGVVGRIQSRGHRRTLPPTVQQAYYYATVLALAPVMYFGMRSIGRAGAYETILIVVFEIIACFYISKRS
jgi:hypothetical protein